MNIKKVSVIRLKEYKDSAVKRSKIYHFALWCADKYHISPRGIYEKLRRGRTKRWEWEGIENCVREYKPGWDGDLKRFWDEQERSRCIFSVFMEDKDMSYSTVWKRFSKPGFSEIEMRGLRSLYKEYMASEKTN